MGKNEKTYAELVAENEVLREGIKYLYNSLICMGGCDICPVKKYGIVSCPDEDDCDATVYRFLTTGTTLSQQKKEEEIAKTGILALPI